jgi:hypothetical protein
MKQYRELNKKRLAAQKQKLREEQRKTLLDIIGDGRCNDCGNDDHRVLEFDHVDGEKTHNVAYFLTRNWARAVEEAQKCDVVCANCHTIRTYERREKFDEVESQWLTLSKECCPKGHPKTEENSVYYVKKNGHRQRYCKPCKREAARKTAKKKYDNTR